jgi:hypothetical protein
MPPPAVTPRGWHVYSVDLEPMVGTKPGTQRRCLAMQPIDFGEAGRRSTVVLPLATRFIEGDAFRPLVRVPAGVCHLTKDSGYRTSWFLLMRCTRRSRRARRLGGGLLIRGPMSGSLPRGVKQVSKLPSPQTRVWRRCTRTVSAQKRM